MTTIFVTNASLQILARVTWRRAAVLLTTNVARNIEGTPLVRVVHSPSISQPIHKVVAIRRDAYRPFAGKSMEGIRNRMKTVEICTMPGPPKKN